MPLPSEPTRPTPVTCSDLKAALSAYLDDELTRDERLHADAHLIDCGKCRTLVERAEALDDTLRRKFAEDLDAAAQEIPADSVDTAAMQAQVFASIGARERKLWLPRLAIAASIVAAVATSVALWRASNAVQGVGPSAPGEFVRGDDAPRAVPPVAAPSQGAVQLASLDADDRQLLYSTGVILQNLRKSGFDNPAQREELSAIARYDELVDRLDALVARVDPKDRPAVTLARETIEAMIETSADPKHWDTVRRDMERNELDVKLDRLSEA